jgi:hypothetical protein
MCRSNPVITFFINLAYWKTAMLVHLYFLNGCFSSVTEATALPSPEYLFHDFL